VAPWPPWCSHSAPRQAQGGQLVKLHLFSVQGMSGFEKQINRLMDLTAYQVQPKYLSQMMN
jgi:hypothetical protein